MKTCTRYKLSPGRTNGLPAHLSLNYISRTVWSSTYKLTIFTTSTALFHLSVTTAVCVSTKKSFLFGIAITFTTSDWLGSKVRGKTVWRESCKVKAKWKISFLPFLDENFSFLFHSLHKKKGDDERYVYFFLANPGSISLNLEKLRHCYYIALQYKVHTNFLPI